MVFRHQGGAKPRPVSEPPPRQSPLNCGTPKTPAHDPKEKPWFRKFFKRKGHHPKAWTSTSLAVVGDVLPPPPPSPPRSQSEEDGGDQDTQDTSSEPIEDNATHTRETKIPGEQPRSPSIPLGRGESVSESATRDKFIPNGNARCDSPSKASRWAEDYDRSTNSDSDVHGHVPGPIAAKRTLKPREKICAGDDGMPKAAKAQEKPTLNNLEGLPQRPSQALVRRSTPVDSGISEEPIRLTLPPGLSAEASDKAREKEVGGLSMEVEADDRTSRRSSTSHQSRANLGANSQTLVPCNAGPSRKTVAAGMLVLCLDIRSSVDDGSAIERWRKAEIAEVSFGESGPTIAKVRFWGAEAPTVSLRLKEHWNRLALPGSLTTEEMETGAPLEGAVMAVSKKTFKPRSRHRGRSRGTDERRRDRSGSGSGSHRRSTSVPSSRFEGRTLAGLPKRRPLTLGASESFEDMQKHAEVVEVMSITRGGSVESDVSPPQVDRTSETTQTSDGDLAAGKPSNLRSKSPDRRLSPPVMSRHSRRGSTGRITGARSPLRHRQLRRGSGSNLGDGAEGIRRTESDASGRSVSSSRRRWRVGEERQTSTSRHPSPGDRFDCYDYDVSNKTQRQMRTWREAEVVKVEYTPLSGEETEIRVLVHFPTWSSKYDYWVSLTREPERFAPLFSKARPAAERFENAGVNQAGSSLSQQYQYRGRAGSNSTASTSTPTVTTASSSSNSGGMGRSAARGYVSDGLGEGSTRHHRGSSRTHGERKTHSDRVVPRRKSGMRRPRSPGGRLIITGDVVSTASSTVTSGGCSNSPVTSEVDSVGSSDSLFREAMRRKGLSVIDVEPDGNCLFRSVSHQIYGDADRHNQVRKACVDHMSKHKARFGVFVAEDFRDYLYKIRQPGVWGDDLEIRALEELFDRPIEIYSSEAEDLRPMKIDFDASELDLDATPIKLSYHGQSHYNSVRDKSLRYPLQPLRTKNILHIRQAQHARTPRSASVSRAGGGRVGEGPGSEVLNRRTARRSRFGGLRDSSPFSQGASNKAGSTFRTLLAGFSSKIM